MINLESRRVFLIGLVLIALLSIGIGLTLGASLIRGRDQTNDDWSAGNYVKLRYLIDRANGEDSSATIVLINNIALEGELPHVTSAITIEGYGHSISGAEKYRVFYVGENGHLTLNHVTIRDGKVSAPDQVGEDVQGGGIKVNGGKLDIKVSEFSGNRVTSDSTHASGGGIYVDNGTVTITYSRLSNNEVQGGGPDGDGFGGGIAIKGKNSSVTIINSTLSENTATTSGNNNVNEGKGAGIYVGSDGELTLENSTLSDNTATSQNGERGLGGGINVNKGTVKITNSTLLGNTANEGGGINVEDETSTVIILNSTLTGNRATSDDERKGGGGIFNKGTLEIQNSTLSSNSATRSDGGGIYNFDGTVKITDSTLSGNAALKYGGGVNNHKESKTSTTVAFVNSTLSHNSAKTGGGIYNDNALAYLAGTMLVGNTQGGGQNCSEGSGGSTTDNGYNLSDDDTCTSSATGSTKNVTNINLGPLTDNGGPTQTHALLADSAALNKIPLNFKVGEDNLCPSGGTDQRGEPRPVDGKCDIGAYEAGP
jgi:hypothetical protein